VHIAGISFGMQNLLRTSTGGVAFAQPPATSLNPYRMKTDDVKAVQKILMWQKYRTQKNGLHIFLRSIFLPIQGPSVEVGALLVFSVGFWRGSPVFTTTRSTASKIPQKPYSHNSVATTTTIQPVTIRSEKSSKSNSTSLGINKVEGEYRAGAKRT
jgi:hypothetical protein